MLIIGTTGSLPGGRLPNACNNDRESTAIKGVKLRMVGPKCKGNGIRCEEA